MDYLKTLKELQEYYSNLLIIQYNGKPKAKATIELIANLIWSNMALIQIRDAFDWKTAKGVQLDIIGKWVGVSRAYNENNTWSNTYLSYPSYGTDTIAEADSQRGGYSTYADFDTLDGGVLTYKDLQNNKQQLDDDDYRTVIGLKIIKNNIVHNQGNIDNAIWAYFDGNSVYYTTNNIAVGTILYTDNTLSEVFGEVINVNSNKITVQRKDSVVVYDYSYNVVEKDIRELKKGNSSNLGALKNEISNVVFKDNSFYFKATSNTTSQPLFVSSNDGVSVKKETFSNLADFDSFCYGNGKFIGLKNNKVYLNLKSNTSITLNNNYNCIAYGNGKFVIIGYGKYAYSTDDGATWTEATSNKLNYTWKALIYDGTKFVGLSSNGYTAVSGNGTLWGNSVRVNNSGVFVDIIFCNNKYIALTDLGQVYESSSLSSGWEKTQNLQSINRLNPPISNFCKLGTNGTNYFVIGYNSSSKTYYFSGSCIRLGLGNVYTTWQPHIITYHYPTRMTTVMNICKYKNVLLAPTGVSIQLASY
jgi:hypothetical protein